MDKVLLNLKLSHQLNNHQGSWVIQDRLVLLNQATQVQFPGKQPATMGAGQVLLQELPLKAKAD